MSLSDEEYGKVIRTYRGKGKLKRTDGNELPCHITIQQIETGLIYITCKFAPKVAQDTATIQFIMDSPRQDVELIYGKIRGGMDFESRGKLFIVHSEVTVFANRPATITLLAQEINLWKENQCHARCYRFSVVNFEFTGNHPVKKTITKNDRKTERIYLDLQLETPWGIAEIDPVADYDNVISKIKAQKGISATCALLAKPKVHMELKGVIAKVDELCKLLSLARGTKINWVNAESYTQGDQLCQTILKNSIAWPFSHHALIDPQNPNDTPFFIKKIYPAYLRHRDSYNLDIAIEQFLDAKRETVYLETRGLAAASLLDSLQQQYASGHGLTEIVKDFGKQKNGVRECLKNFITSAFPNIKKEELDEIVGKIPELNRRSFLNLSKKWMGDLGLQIPDSELSAIKDTRNSLAHRMCFKSSDKREKIREYFRLINLINQVFLKLLDYKGYFIHVDLKTLAFERRELE